LRLVDLLLQGGHRGMIEQRHDFCFSIVDFMMHFLEGMLDYEMVVIILNILRAELMEDGTSTLKEYLLESNASEIIDTLSVSLNLLVDKNPAQITISRRVFAKTTRLCHCATIYFAAFSKKTT
jgi:hypothetical protein